MAAIALALGSSALWGLADFLGGVKSRRYAVPLVLGVMYVTSLGVMAVVVAVSGDPRPDGEGLVAALLAGVAGIAGLAAFYRALAIGTMSIVAPVASTGVALPVLVGIFGGEDPGVARGIGIAVAVVGVVLASREDDGGADDARQQRVSILLALAAGVGFGSYFVGAEIASRDSVAWALLLTRVAATPLVLAAALVALRRGGARPRGRELAALAAIGVLDLGANALYNQATTMGDLSVVAVASSLYPVMTVLLAAALLGERVRGVQRFGVAVAVVGVLMIAGGA